MIASSASSTSNPAVFDIGMISVVDSASGAQTLRRHRAELQRPEHGTELKVVSGLVVEGVGTPGTWPPDATLAPPICDLAFLKKNHL